MPRVYGVSAGQRLGPNLRRYLLDFEEFVTAGGGIRRG